ncbi:uncharacterized protein A4U43_C02F14820 [Asparagus officinalis]|uniref:EF-hand domain-containing protein n=1 Tax=Asparagus officinalis TaxID=4686 RepID=A0A5P1FIK9_ASPOF|nr:probable calcium-binding protein CML30 [Asparagus officinalis]ONK78146.1 uncharacterized protein A4U43_C02F14820 [Asparagus officinalis]
MEGATLTLYIVNSLIYSSITNVFKDLLHFYSIFTCFLSSILRYIIHDDECDDEEDEAPSVHCERELSIEDVNIVIKRLGMGELLEEERWREELDEMLEEKEANLEEIKEAFYVFDRNEDGFITAEEVWSVMRRLGMREGVRVEDCVRMVSVFDKDGDGRISCFEFRRLLESAM